MNKQTAGSIGGLTTIARHGAEQLSRAGVNARWQKFLAEVDPNNELPEDERNYRARRAQSAYMKRLGSMPKTRRGKR